MSPRDVVIHCFAAALMLVALWLLYKLDWHTALGVFLFVWGNNLIYSTRLKYTIKKGVWK
jgi:hypothetical protein